MQTSSSQPLRHLLAVDDLSTESLQTLFTLADQYKDTPFQNTLKNKSICSVFFEPSTRTFCSFSLAAQRLGASVVTFTESVSSTSKGESLIDTIDTLTAMQFDALVIRHQNDTTADQLAEHCGDKIAIINAGTGICHHPSQ
ncbi:MAG: aspartate carbamoyltransferase catalytic subunit, partial [Coxiellaceae bacterium]|nr:aspartate carbamoyltransferase catalytic subunit [Coxiellaceae bacterium]